MRTQNATKAALEKLKTENPELYKELQALAKAAGKTIEAYCDSLPSISKKDKGFIEAARNSGNTGNVAIINSNTELRGDQAALFAHLLKDKPSGNYRVSIKEVAPEKDGVFSNVSKGLKTLGLDNAAKGLETVTKYIGKFFGKKEAVAEERHVVARGDKEGNVAVYSLDSKQAKEYEKAMKNNAELGKDKKPVLASAGAEKIQNILKGSTPLFEGKVSNSAQFINDFSKKFDEMRAKITGDKAVKDIASKCAAALQKQQGKA